MGIAGHLLVVDDESELVEILAEYFTGLGYTVSGANSAAAARDVFAASTPDLAILDLRMPGEDGLSLARWIREQHRRVGIIMLTTAAEAIDRVVGLEMGADDYVPKPFELRELQARVKAVLRRLQDVATPTQAPSVANDKIRFGTCELDLQAHKLFNDHNEEVPVTAMEFDLLSVFAQSPNRVLNRDQLMELAHNRGWDVFDRSIDLRIMRLRRKIEPDPEKPQVIKTIRGVGYMYVKP
jgi:two-component system phosphate regulon response regulator OmpR